jgi:glyoxylase-like metal-dependent hydrolase (beta-lactamase superfamily II)/rhodanese-related sulfurtransferase
MSTPADTIGEIPPEVFETELRNGADVVIVDTRDRAAFAEWHVDPAGARLINIPEAELVEDPAGALAHVDPTSHVRVICNAGNASLRSARALQGHATEILSVRGGLIGWSRVLAYDEVPLDGPIGLVQFRREARGCLSYMLIAADQAMVIDPAPDIAPYLAVAAQRGVAITRVLDTHIHADHLSGARDLARRTGAALHMSAAALARGVQFGDEVTSVMDGAILSIGDAEVTVVALPGHTSDMIGVRIGEDALVGGDSLFVDSVARPDLETGDAGAPESARLLYRTLHERILGLPDSIRLAPCHYGGGRLAGPLAPTLGDVRASVLELGLDEHAFVTRVLSAIPPRPANYLAIIGVNMGDDTAPDDAARLEIGANNCAASPGWADSTP